MTNVVLDIDECLVHMFAYDVDWELYNSLRLDVEKRTNLVYIEFDKFRMWGLKRPGLDEFLEFCFKNFKTVSVWSAGTTNYVFAVVDAIFRDHRYPDNVLTWDNVKQETHHERNDFYCKPLETFFSFQRGANKSNTILIDNQLANSKYDPHNIIHVPDFLPEQSLSGVSKNDDCFKILIRWFETFSPFGQDVRTLNKQLFNPLD